MGTSKQDRKYNKVKPKESGLKFKVLVNNNYYLPDKYDTWEEAEAAGARHIRGKRMCYVVVTGV